MVKVGDYCLWGKINYIKKVAEGIQEVRTPGHGGYKLDRKHNSVIHPTWRKKSGWYEKDREYAIVWYTFPEDIVKHKLMTQNEVISQAVYTLKNYYPDEYEDVTGEKVTAQESRKVAEREFAFKHANDYLVVNPGYTSSNGDITFHHGKSECFLVPGDKVDQFIEGKNTFCLKMYVILVGE